MPDNFPKRKRIRLKDYDYSTPDTYFVTICADSKKHIFGEIPPLPSDDDYCAAAGQELCSCRLSKVGIIVENEIINLEKRYPNLTVDKYVIMPNHVHLLIELKGCGQRQEQSPCPTLSDVICSFKSITTKQANKAEYLSGRKIWQYRFYDHIIRNDKDYDEIWDYIDQNPLEWASDKFYILKNQRVINSTCI